MDVLSSFLVKLAPSSAAGWIALGAVVFRGRTEVETANSVYAFEDGVLVTRAKKPGLVPETTTSLAGLRLVGFLSDEDGLYALSPRWRPGALAVFFRAPAPDATADARSFVVTTATEAFRVPPVSAVRLARSQEPPSVRRLLPASLTRLHAATVAF